MKKYVIAIITHSNYRRHEVLEYRGGFPTVFRYDNFDYDTEEEAAEALFELARSISEDHDSWSYYNDKLIEDDRKDGLDTDWYVGEGIYDSATYDHSQTLLRGDLEFEDDDKCYRVWELDD